MHSKKPKPPTQKFKKKKKYSLTHKFCNNVENTKSPSNPYWRCAKWSGGKVLSWIFFTNLRAVSGGSPVPVVEITITTGSFSVSRLYYK